MADVEVSTHIAAPAARVWDLIGDPARMGEWSPECTGATWHKSTPAPALGAKFTGHNRRGWRRWSTTGKVVDFAPGERIAWDVSVMMFPVARWGYAITPDADGTGCTLVETFDDHRDAVAKVLGRPVRGVADVPTHNRQGMDETLAHIKAAAEGG